MSNKEQTIEFDIAKSDFKKVLQAHKRFALSTKNAESSELSWVNFKVTDEELIISTTDRTKSLLTKLKLADNYQNTGEFNLSMACVSKLNLSKGLLNKIRVKKTNEYVEFYDADFDLTQKIVAKSEDISYPNVEKLLPKKNNFTVCLSTKLIKDIASMKTSSGVVELKFDTSDNLSNILCEAGSESEGIYQQAILAPIDKPGKTSKENK